MRLHKPTMRNFRRGRRGGPHMSVTATPRGKSMRRYGGTLSTMGRPDKPLPADGLRPRLSGKAFGRQERASRVASTRVTFVGRIPNLGLLHVFAGR